GSGYQWIGPGGSGYNAAPAWSPSGTTLAFGLNPGSLNWLYTSDLSGNERSLLTPGDSGLTIASWPSYSPDGATIYFSGATTDNFAVWRANADGTAPHQLYADPSGWPGGRRRLQNETGWAAPKGIRHTSARSGLRPPPRRR